MSTTSKSLMRKGNDASHLSLELDSRLVKSVHSKMIRQLDSRGQIPFLSQLSALDTRN